MYVTSSLRQSICNEKVSEEAAVVAASGWRLADSVKRNMPGESWILATLSSPRPLRNSIRVVEACARICPLIGLRPSAPAKSVLVPGSTLDLLGLALLC
jgi:hypothetical protein